MRLNDEEHERKIMDTSRTTIVMSGVGIGAMLLVLIWFAPPMVWILVTLGALVMAVAVLMPQINRKRPADVSPAPMPASSGLTFQLSESQAVPISDVLLPSAVEDYCFKFSATVLWSPVDPAVDPFAADLPTLAVEEVLRRARAVVSRRDPSEVSLVRYELGGSLALMRQDSTGTVRAMARSVRLTLPEGDRERLDRLADLRKRKAIWEHERLSEQSRREYLGEDVLKDMGSAVVWWLAKNNDEVEKAVQDIGILAQLTSAANSTEVPEAFLRHLESTATETFETPAYDPSPADRFTDFLQSLRIDDEANSMLYVRRIVQATDKHGRSEAAAEIAHRFGLDEPEDDPAGADPKQVEDPDRHEDEA